MASKTTTRTGNKKQFSKPRIKPWMVSVFVALIAVVGVVVVYRSFAAELPQSIIDEAAANVTVLPDGRAKVSVPSLNYEKIFNQIDTARALSDPAYYNELMNRVLEELKVLYNKKYPSTPPPTTPQQTPQPTPQPSPKPSTPTTPTQPNTPSQQNPSQTPSQQSPSQPTSPNQPTTVPDNNIESQNQAEEAINSLEYDLQDPSTMPTYSRIATFSLTPPSNISQADTVGVYVDKKLLKAIKPSSREFSIDTTRLENGVHRLDVVVYDKSDNPLARYVFMFKTENNLSFIDRVISTISSPFAGLFGI